MSVWLKSLIKLLSIFIIQTTVSAQEASISSHFFEGNPENPEEVLNYLKTVPKNRNEMAEKMYQHALRHAKRKNVSWGSVIKSCYESVSSYPTGKAFLLGSEGMIKEWAFLKKGNPEISERFLEEAKGWLDSAIAVEAYEPSLDKTQRSRLVPYRDCLKRYLDTGKTEPGCVPLQWAGKAPGK